MKQLTLLVAALMLAGATFAGEKDCCKKKGEKCDKSACCKDKKNCHKECSKDGEKKDADKATK